MSSENMLLNMEVDNEGIKDLQKLYKDQDLSLCFARLHQKLSDSVDAIRVDVKSLTSRVENLESYREGVEDELKNVHEKLIPNIESTIEGEKNERLELEIWGKKWNLVIRGVPGKLNERPKDTDKAVRDFCETVLKIPGEAVDEMYFQATHRLPGGDENKKSIIVRFGSLIDRDEVLFQARKLKPGSGYSVTPDLPPEISVKRSQLLRERAQMPNEQKKNTKLIYVKEYPFVKLWMKS